MYSISDTVTWQLYFTFYNGAYQSKSSNYEARVLRVVARALLCSY